MGVPEFVVELRRHVGRAPLWLIGVTVIVVRGAAGAEDVLLVRRADDGRWTPVTGIVDPGEEPDEAGRREVAEETGLDVELTRLLAVESTPEIRHVNGDQARYLDHAFLAEPAGDGARDGAHPADGENTEVRWVPLAEVPPMGDRFDRAVARAVEVRRGGEGARPPVLFGAARRER